MNRTFVLIRLSLKQLIWQMARTFGGWKKFSSLLVFLATAMLIGLSGLYSWAMIESVPTALNMLILLMMLSAAFGLILVFITRKGIYLTFRIMICWQACR